MVTLPLPAEVFYVLTAHNQTLKQQLLSSILSKAPLFYHTTGLKNAPVATTAACFASIGAPGSGDDVLQ